MRRCYLQDQPLAVVALRLRLTLPRNLAERYWYVAAQQPTRGIVQHQVVVA